MPNTQRYTVNTTLNVSEWYCTMKHTFEYYALKHVLKYCYMRMYVCTYAHMHTFTFMNTDTRTCHCEQNPSGEKKCM